VVENTTGVATYTANEPVTWSLNGGADAARFPLTGGARCLFTAAPGSRGPVGRRCEQRVCQVVVRATDVAGNTADQSVTVTVTDADEIPPIIAGSTTPSVVENTTGVATYTANEPVTWSHQWRSRCGPLYPHGRIVVLRPRRRTTKPRRTPMPTTRMPVVIRATDAAGNTADQSVMVTVIDADEIPPIIAGSTAPSVVENTTVVATYTADEPVTWSLNGGADAARFTLTGGALSFTVAPNYEAPADADANNAYAGRDPRHRRGREHRRSVCDGDRDRRRRDCCRSSRVRPRRRWWRTPPAVATYTANEPVTWSLNGGADAARFTLSGGALVLHRSRRTTRRLPTPMRTTRMPW
jgi:hypothetical protein